MKRAKNSGSAHQHQNAREMTRVRAQQRRATEKYEQKKLQRESAPNVHVIEGEFIRVGVVVDELLRRFETNQKCAQLTLWDAVDLSDANRAHDVGETATKATESAATSKSSSEIISPGDQSSSLETEAPAEASIYVSPPARAEYLLYLCLPPEQRECLPGDLYEEYNEVILIRFGESKAKWWYWGQVIRSIWPIVGQRVVRLLRWGVVARAADALWKRFVA